MTTRGSRGRPGVIRRLAVAMLTLLVLASASIGASASRRVAGRAEAKRGAPRKVAVARASRPKTKREGATRRASRWHPGIALAQQLDKTRARKR